MAEHDGTIRGVRCEILRETTMPPLPSGVVLFCCRFEDRFALADALVGLGEQDDGPYRLPDDLFSVCRGVDIQPHGVYNAWFIHLAIVTAYFGPPGSQPEFEPDPDPGPPQSWRTRPSFLGGMP